MIPGCRDRSDRGKLMTRGETGRELLNFIAVEPFWRLWERSGLNEDDMIALENVILANPRKGDLVAGTGGFRKIRLAGEGSNRGKSGSHRVLYLYLEAYGTVFFVVLFGKGDRANISKADANELAKRAAGLKLWAKERYDQWRSQIPRR
jgi:hypothetical protein